MSDLVERLRNASVDYAVQEGGFTDDGWLLREAANRIEQQQAEIEQLRAERALRFDRKNDRRLSLL